MEADAVAGGGEIGVARYEGGDESSLSAHSQDFLGAGMVMI